MCHGGIAEQAVLSFVVEASFGIELVHFSHRREQVPTIQSAIYTLLNVFFLPTCLRETVRQGALHTVPVLGGLRQTLIMTVGLVVVERGALDVA